MELSKINSICENDFSGDKIWWQDLEVLKQQVGQTWLARLENCPGGNTVKLTAR